MINIDNFIKENITLRPVSMFAADIKAHEEQLFQAIRVEVFW